MSVTGTPASLNSFKYIVNDPSVKTIITGRALKSDTTSPPKLHQDHTSWTCICVYLGLRRTHKLRVWAVMRATGVFLLLARIAQAPIPRGIITRRRRTTIISIGNHSILVASSSCLARSSVPLYVTRHTIEIHRDIHTKSLFHFRIVP